MASRYICDLKWVIDTDSVITKEFVFIKNCNVITNTYYTNNNNNMKNKFNQSFKAVTLKDKSSLV